MSEASASLKGSPINQSSDCGSLSVVVVSVGCQVPAMVKLSQIIASRSCSGLCGIYLIRLGSNYLRPIVI